MSLLTNETKTSRENINFCCLVDCRLLAQKITWVGASKASEGVCSVSLGMCGQTKQQGWDSLNGLPPQGPEMGTFALAAAML